MSSEANVSLTEFREVLGLFEQALRLDLLESADEVLTYARQIVNGLSKNRTLVQSLTDEPDTVKGLVATLLAHFHQVADDVIPGADDPDRQSEEQNARITLMWRLWPVLHRLLVLQSNADVDAQDYEQKASELYGVLAEAMESPTAVAPLQGCFNEVLPLPGA